MAQQRAASEESDWREAIITHSGQMVFGVAPANASRDREAPVSLLGILLLVAAMLLLGVYMPVGLDRVLSRATEIILG